MGSEFEAFEDDGTEGANVGYRSYGGEEDSQEKDQNEDEENEGDDNSGSDDDDDDLEDELDEDEDEDEDDGDDDVSDDIKKERKRLSKIHTQEIAKLKLQYDRSNPLVGIESDPEQVLGALAKKYGYELVEEGSSSSDDDDDDDEIEIGDPRKDEPLQDYIKRVVQKLVKKQTKASAKKGKAKEGKGKNVRKSQDQKMRAHVAAQVKYWDAVYPDWRKYGEQIKELTRTEPSLIGDADALYKKAKKLAQKASGKRKKAKSKKLAGRKGKKFKTGERGRGSSKTKAKPKVKGKMTWDQAWEAAKNDLRG